MPDARYACGWVPRFRVAALGRSDPALRGHPVAILAAPSPPVVLEVSPEAWARGVRPGMSASEAKAWIPELVTRPGDPEAERSAAAALLDAAWTVSPRVEVAGPDRVNLDLAGLAPLFGGVPGSPAPAAPGAAAPRGRPDPRVEAAIGQRLSDLLAGLDLPVHVAIADTRTAAGLMARRAAGVTVVPAGTAASALAPLPVGILGPGPDLREALERWGVRTLGELAALPGAALLTRLGRPGVALQALARGEDREPFVAAVPPARWGEALALDWEVTSLEGLGFVLGRLLDRLAARLRMRDLGAATLRLTARLADGGAHEQSLRLVAPLQESRTLARLLSADLAALVLPAPIVALAVEAEPAPLRPRQADLFAPPHPSPRELGETLGRLAVLVGAARVGAPVLPDTHRPDAVTARPFTDAPRAPGRPPAAPGRRPPATVTGAATVCRRFVPPLPAVVTTEPGEPGCPRPPSHVEAPGVRGPVVARAGPWRTTGDWWTDTAWAREEWDVALPDGAVYRLARDGATSAWTVDAVYD